MHIIGFEAERGADLRKSKTLLAKYIAAKRAEAEATHSLEAIGFDIMSDYRNNYRSELRLHYSCRTKKLDEFDTETKSVRTALEELKRQYTLKLFAGGEEAQELFASFARELAAIITR